MCIEIGGTDFLTAVLFSVFFFTKDSSKLLSFVCLMYTSLYELECVCVFVWGYQYAQLYFKRYKKKTAIIIFWFKMIYKVGKIWSLKERVSLFPISLRDVKSQPSLIGHIKILYYEQAVEFACHIFTIRRQWLLTCKFAREPRLSCSYFVLLKWISPGCK